MSNTASISSRRRLVSSAVTAQLNEINVRRFNGFFTIEEVRDQGWKIACQGSAFGWYYWMKHTNRTVYGQHPAGPRWVHWCWTIFQNELATLWQGRLSDEACDGAWYPSLDWCGTFDNYLRMMLQPIDHRILDQAIAAERASLPPELLNL